MAIGRFMRVLCEETKTKKNADKFEDQGRSADRIEKSWHVLPRQSQASQKDHLNDTRDKHADSMSPGCLDVDLVIAQAVVAELSVVVQDFVLGLDYFWVVLEVHVSCDETAIQLNDLGDLQFTVSWFIQSAGSLNDLSP